MTANVLSGLRVVELSAFIAAPLAGTTLASLGADVIRVEQLGGGIDAKRWPLHDGRSLYRAGLDRGKRSMTLDLRSESGQDLVRELVVRSGILISNLPEPPWLRYDDLRELRPDVIVVRVSGAADGRSAVDYTVNAETGFPFVTGPENAVGPINHALPAWDVTTAMMTVNAVLAAELHRRATGEGQLVELALADVAVAIAGHLGYLDEARLISEPRPRVGNFIYGSFGRDFQTSDSEYVFVGAMTPRHWRGLASATGLTEHFAELEQKLGVDFTDEAARYEERRRLADLLAPWFAGRTFADVSRALEEAGALWGRYRTFKEVVAEGAAGEAFASPIAFGAFGRPPARTAPEIGSDTAEVLEELGVDAADVGRLRAGRVIA